MQSRIVLIRHGRSGHTRSAGWMTADGMQRWRDTHDAVGIDAGEAPPAALVAEAARATLVVASDLARAVESADRLAAGRVSHVSPLLREMPLAIPGWLPLRWPLWVWEAAIHLQWGYWILRGTDASPAEVARAAAAAAWLAELAEDGATIAVVTHGVFRRLVEAQLLALGWKSEPRARGYRHWSAWGFTRGDRPG